MKYIKVAEANCRNCYKCLKVCPVKSIRYSDNHVEVLEIDLVTEGVLTIKKPLSSLNSMRRILLRPRSQRRSQKNGAARLARLLAEDCTELNLFMGTAVNPAHRLMDFPAEFRAKTRLLDDLAALMERLGREVSKRRY